MDLLPSLNKVFSLVIQEESNNAAIPSISTLEDSNVLVNASDATKPQGRGKGSYNKPPTIYVLFAINTITPLISVIKSMAFLV